MMVELQEELSIPLGMINTLAYCPRRFGYEFVQGEMLINAHVLEGLLLHEEVDLGGRAWVDDGRQARRVSVWSDRLRVHGVCDVVEERAGFLYPVEYKKGKPNRWVNDHAQLCLQAMCLEEQLGITIAQGEIFYFAVRRREVVVFTPALRAEVMYLVSEAHRIAQDGTLPPPIEKRAKCRDCSLQPMCLPEEMAMLKSQKGQLLWSAIS